MAQTPDFMAELGEEFRAAREARALSLSDVSEQIHIRSVHLESIENGDWSSIGAPVYVRGFLRTYARFLDLDPEAAVAAYTAEAGVPAPSPAAPVRTVPISMRAQRVRTAAAASERRGVPPLLAMLSVVALLVIGAVVYLAIAPPGAESQRGRGTDAASASPATPIAVVAPPTRAAAIAPARPSLSVFLTQSSWLRVIVDGRPIVEGIYPAGTRKAFSGGTIDVRAGNAGGVQLVRNGKPLGPMGPAGDVVERSIKLAEE